MTIEDATRLLRQPAKHYRGSRLQMGRTIVDSDFNEGVMAAADDLRAAALAVVGPAASPDQGFQPDLAAGVVIAAKSVRFGSLTPLPVLDFNLKPGSMYLGGRRFEQSTSEPVLFQRAYLQMGPTTAPRAKLGIYRQLALLRGSEQSVTAVEDAELQEVALGGADSGVRVRNSAHVEVHEVKASSCADAFNEVLAELTQQGGVSYDPATSELRSNARLQLKFETAALDDCAACSPSLRGRYLGSEPNTLRIMLTAMDRFVWAFDNAAPLYRARFTLDGGGGAKIEFVTPPKDSYHEPSIDTVVELLPWAVLLDEAEAAPGNVARQPGRAEKLAARTGVLAEVDEPYDPATRSLHVRLSSEARARLGAQTSKASSKLSPTKSSPSPEGDLFATEWDSRHPQVEQLNVTSAGSASSLHIYLRVWHVKQSGAEASIPTSSARALGRTGIVPRFSGKGRAGDFWIATVRPAAPEQILPLEIMADAGTPPAGPVDVVAPLSLLEWHSNTGSQHTLRSIRDCRPRLSSLSERGCCTYVVAADGSGDFPTIQRALDALPRAGGHVCVMAGDYDELLLIRGRTDVTLEGCGAEVNLAPNLDAELDPALPVLRVVGEGTLVVRELAVAARGRIGIQVEGAHVRVENVSVFTGPSRTRASESALAVVDAEDVRISACHFVMAPSLTDHAAVYVRGARVRVEDNVVEARGGPDGSLAWGGIQIAGGTREVSLNRNLVRGGRGHGITLGSVRFRARDGSELLPQGPGAGQTDKGSPSSITGAIEPISRPGQDGAALLYFPDPDEAIVDLVVRDNRVLEMGSSGIASLSLELHHQGEALRPPLCIRRKSFDLEGASIDHNDVSNNERTLRTAGVRPLGGIILSRGRDLRVEANAVEDNATRASVPVFGIFVARGERVTIAGNRVRRNGRALVTASNIARFAGGVVLGVPTNTASGKVDLDALVSEVLVRDNVVEQATGPALVLSCTGATAVSRNFLSATQPSAPSSLNGATVHLFHRARPWEALELPAGEPDPARWVQPAGSVAYLRSAEWDAFGERRSGGVRFSHNQVSSFSSAALASPPVVLLSTSDLQVQKNQFSARLAASEIWAHVLVVGATVNVAGNRVSENLRATQTSLVSMASITVTTSENITTHCVLVYSPNNQGNPAYYSNEDNLIWFSPAQNPCARLSGRLLRPLGGLWERVFGTHPITLRQGEDSL